MALSPGIPTSFVPKQPVQAPKRRMAGGTDLFLIGSLSIAGIALLAAGGVFAYDRYLMYVRDAKAAELAAAQGSVDQETVEEFVRLRNRFVSGKELLNQHVVLTQFFATLEDATLQNVRLANMNLRVAGDRTATLEVSGTARNFNTLAAQSNSIAANPRFKRAIFSGISLNQDNTVSFRMSADIDSKLIVLPPARAAAPVEESQPLVPSVPATVPQTPTGTTTAPAQGISTSSPAKTTPKTP